MLSSDIVERELKALIQNIAGGRTPLTHSTAIYHDLSIAGDDAAELIEKVAVDFDVSFDGFDFATYFPNETELGPISYWARRLGLYTSKRPKLTVGHLLAVVQRKGWFPPERFG